MSAQGRGPDSTLVHMTPREVEGLQKLALAHGTTLTINPQTGLPEAFSLKDLLPTIAGAALNYFAPGFGTAIGGALGLSGAAGTGLAVGAATAALSGDLGKGLSAGLGAYGGAGITEGLMGLGTGALSAEAGAAASKGLEGVAADQAAEQAIKTRLADASKFDTLSAGAANAMSNPGNALSALGGGSKLKGGAILASALSPLLAGETGNTVQTVTPRQSTGMIRPFTYDPHYQEYTRGTPYAAAKGGLMGLAHGGAVHYEEGGPVGAAVPFNMDDYIRNYVKRFEPLAATNTGQGFAATAAPVTQAAPVAAATAAPANIFAATDYFDPNANFMSANPADTTSKNTAFANSAGAAAPVAQAGIAALPNAGAAMSAAAPITWTGQAQSPLITDQVFDLYKNVLDRPPKENEMKYWATAFGKNNSTIDPNEVADFRSAASKELAERTADFDSSKNYIPISKLDDLYMQELSRHGEYGTGGKEGGMEFWKRTFGDYIDPTELAGFKAEAAKEIAKRPVVVNPVVQKPAVVTDLTTAGTQYIAPGVSGSTGAGQIGGGTVVNPNGTITTSPRIPGIPVGGFTGMTQVRDSYTKGGGDLGYTSYAPKSIAEFNEKYKNTGYQKEMYDYLMGKGDMPTKIKNADGTYREIMRPYNEATLGAPASTNKRLTWDKTKGEYFRNPDYVHTARSLILDAAGKPKLDADGNYLYNTTTYKSINQAKAGIADNKLTKDSGGALLDWATQNNVEEQTVADALGIPLQEVISMFAKVKADKKIPAKNGGLMQLANGGMAYDIGGSVKTDYIDSQGETHVWDWENGIYRPKTLSKNGKSYTWDKVSNNYKLAGADAGIASLVNTTNDTGRGNDAINPPNTTPITNNGFFANILGRTTQPAAPVVEKSTYSPLAQIQQNQIQRQQEDDAAMQAQADREANSAQAARSAESARYSGLSGLQARQAEVDADALENAQVAVNAQKARQDEADDAVMVGNNAASEKATNAAHSVMAQAERNQIDAQAEQDAAIQSQANREAQSVENARNVGQKAMAADIAALVSELSDNPNANPGRAPSLGTGTTAGWGGSDIGGSDLGGGGEGLGGGVEGNGSQYAYGGMAGYAQGGLGSLGGYSDGGRLLRGPGDGVSDSIPATVGDRQPARLADGEFVVPARIVSELGNGSTEAGARALYKMMDRIQANRRKTTGKNNVAVNSKSHKYLPA